VLTKRQTFAGSRYLHFLIQEGKLGAMTKKERRQNARMGLGLPVRVQGHDPDGRAWEEMTRSADVSFGGVSLLLRHTVHTGQVLFLALPLPKRYRRYETAESSYHSYTVVRSVLTTDLPPRVGAMFLGKHAPPGYSREPGAAYLLPTGPRPADKDRREHLRLEIFAGFRISKLDGSGQETTVAEDVRKRGALIQSSLPVSKDEILLVEELGGPFRTRARISHIYIGHDNIPRINLDFLDGEAPDRLVSSE
jgi:hypothetical protein